MQFFDRSGGRAVVIAALFEAGVDAHVHRDIVGARAPWRRRVERGVIRGSKLAPTQSAGRGKFLVGLQRRRHQDRSAERLEGLTDGWRRVHAGEFQFALTRNPQELRELGVVQKIRQCGELPERF